MNCELASCIKFDGGVGLYGEVYAVVDGEVSDGDEGGLVWPGGVFGDGSGDCVVDGVLCDGVVLGVGVVVEYEAVVVVGDGVVVEFGLGVYSVELYAVVGVLCDGVVCYFWCGVCAGEVDAVGVVCDGVVLLSLIHI